MFDSLGSLKPYCRHSGNGGHQTCLPAARSVAKAVAQYSPSSSTQAQDPHEGPSLAGQTTGSFLRSNLLRQAREEAERSRQGTSRGARDASHDDRGQVGTRRAPACAVSLFPFRCKGGKHRPRHQAKVTVSVQQAVHHTGSRTAPRKGSSLAGRTTGSFLGSSLVRLAREEAERSRHGYLVRCP